MICAHVESVYFKCLCLCTKDRKVRVRNTWNVVVESSVRSGPSGFWLLGLGKDVMCVSVKGVPRWDDRFGQYSIKVSFCVLGLSCVTVWDPQNRDPRAENIDPRNNGFFRLADYQPQRLGVLISVQYILTCHICT